MVDESNLTERFWERKSLAQMNRDEWEALCDGCGKCCLHKLEDEETRELAYTRVICRYFDESKCRCRVYASRKNKVPDCVVLTPDNLKELSWMPSSCAYRLLHEGKTLPLWHPLLTGNRKAIEESGNTVAGRVISEKYVHPEGLDEHIIKWVK